MNKRKTAPLILWVLTIVISLILRKTGFGIGSWMVSFSFLAIALIVLLKKDIGHFRFRLLSFVFIILTLFYLKGFFEPDVFIFIVLASWLIHAVLHFNWIKENRDLLILSLLITFILISGAIFNVREFYNFYHHGRYEQFVRDHYTENEGIVADLFIERYKNTDTALSSKYLKKAESAVANKDYEQALRYYDFAIDADPENALAYHSRGFLKMTYIDINNDVAWSAIKDFSRAIRLNPNLTMAYFHRAFAFGYLHNYMRSILDNKHVMKVDGVLTDDSFKQKYGVSKKSFSVPFHP